MAYVLEIKVAFAKSFFIQISIKFFDRKTDVVAIETLYSWCSRQQKDIEGSIEHSKYKSFVS